MSSADFIAYFGYGSLVTSETRPAHTRAYPMTLAGWVRQWKHCLDDPFGNGNVCSLTATKLGGSQIDGVLILDRVDMIHVTDRRETGYVREPIEIDTTRLPAEFRGVPTGIYVSTPAYYRWGNAAYPILRTYVDCVLVGFLREFGLEGADRFIGSTEGWQHCPILDDRDDPQYPRAVKLTPGEAVHIDALLKDHSIEMAGRTRQSLSARESA